MWVFELLLSLLGILSFFTIGLTFDYYVISKKKLNFNLATLFGLGLGLVAVFQMVTPLLGVQVNTILIFCTTALSIVPIFADPQLKKQLQKSALQSAKKVKRENLIFLLILVVFFGLVALVTFSHPVWGFDAIDRWLAKAYAFWLDDGVSRANLHGFYIADDPNLWPIVASWLFHFLGKASGFWIQIIPFTALVCIIGEFFRKVAKNKLSVGWAIILVFSPFLWGTVASASYSGNADMLLALYLLLAFEAILGRKLIYAAIFLGFSVLTKNDTLPALVGFCVFLPMFGIWVREKGWGRPVLIAMSFLVFNIGWKLYYGLDSRYLGSNFMVVWQQRPIVAYTRYSVNGFREEFRFVDRWGIGFLVIFFFVFSRIKVVFENKWFLFSLLLFTCQFVGYIAVYYVTKEDQATQIATSIFRLVLQVYPALLLFAYELSVYDNRRESKKILKRV